MSSNPTIHFQGRTVNFREGSQLGNWLATKKVRVEHRIVGDVQATETSGCLVIWPGLGSCHVSKYGVCVLLFITLKKNRRETFFFFDDACYLSDGNHGDMQQKKTCSVSRAQNTTSCEGTYRTYISRYVLEYFFLNKPYGFFHPRLFFGGGPFSNHAYYDLRLSGSCRIVVQESGEKTTRNVCTQW